MTIFRPLAGALAALAIGAPAASAADAEIFATNNTAVITDPADPRLQDGLLGFERNVNRLIEDGGGLVRGSELLDGVFFSAEQGTTTFERSRVFDVDRVEPDELHTIADTIRARFGQQSVLTFDRLPASDPAADAVELDVPSVTAQELRDGLLADQEARDRLFGGSVTQADHLLLVADRADAQFALAFAQRIGGDVRRAKLVHGDREFVEGPLPVRVEQRTLVVAGGSGADAIVIAPRGEVTLNGTAYSIPRHRFDRIRVDAGDGLDTVTFEGGAGVDRFELAAAGDRVRIGDAELDGADILRVVTRDSADRLTVGDLSATDTFQVEAELGAGADTALVNGSEDDDQISLSAFGLLGPTFVRFIGPELADRLTIDGRGGDDIVGASVATMALTLAGGAGDNVLLGGPGDDTLIGGDGFDDVRGGPGRDVARLGGHFDRFSWRSGDGSDEVDGGASRDSLFFEGSNAAEAFALKTDRGGLRLTRSVDGVVMALQHLEEIDAVAGGGADTFAIGDLRRSGAELVDISLAPLPITAGGDGQADRVTVDGTPGRDALTLTGKVVVAGTATLTGLAAKVNISHAEGALDTLAIDTRAGKDTVDTTGLVPGTIGVQIFE